jgi:hypothetical protein
MQIRMRINMIFNSLDISLIFVSALVFLSSLLLMYKRYQKEVNCKVIEINKRNLIFWRFGLYGAVINAFLISYFTFIDQNIIRILFYIIFIICTLSCLTISFPPWICKNNGLMQHCNCDYYEFNDFIFLLLLGSFGSISFIFVIEEYALILLFILVLIQVLTYFYSPMKPPKSIFVPEEISISNLDEIQQFLIDNPKGRKLITLIHSGCDFCELQIDEIMKLTETVKSNIKVLDLTLISEYDPFLLEFLSLNEAIEEIPFPSTLIIENGLSFDRREGVLTVNELQEMVYGII